MVTDGKSLNPDENVVVDFRESEGLLDLSSFERIRAKSRPEFDDVVLFDQAGAVGIEIHDSLFGAAAPEEVIDLTDPKPEPGPKLRDPVSKWARRVRGL
ncbi:MAG: hypothetical protein HKN26_15655 [Acidimicrobiales bacterium]|nr:hypothetical protein [Acidimicrobiales bacterium]